MEKLTRRRYTLEYKQEAVALVSTGQAVAGGALGIVEQTLANWVKAEKAGQLHGVPSEQVSAERMENNRLRAELARVTWSATSWERPRCTSRSCSDDVRLDRAEQAIAVMITPSSRRCGNGH